MNKKLDFPTQCLVMFLMGMVLIGIIISVVLFFPSLIPYYGVSTSIWLIFIPPIVEEGLKYLTFLSFYNKFSLKAFPFLAIGFGFAEGLFRIHRYGYYGIPALWFHIFNSFVMIYWLKDVKKENKITKIVLLVIAFIIPVLFHFTWNLVASGN